MPLSNSSKIKFPALRDVLKASHENTTKSTETNSNLGRNNEILEEKLLPNREEDQSKISSQLSLIDNILDLASKLDNNNSNKYNNRFINEIESLPPPPPPPVERKLLHESFSFRVERKSNLNTNKSRAKYEANTINSQLKKNKCTSQRRLNKENETTKVSSEVDMRKESLLQCKQIDKKEANKEKEIQQSSSSCSSTSSLCNNENKVESEQSVSVSDIFLRQSVDLESYNSKLPLSSSSSYWNYDELNELRIKFISLLSADLNNTKLDENTVSNYVYFKSFRYAHA